MTKEKDLKQTTLELAERSNGNGSEITPAPQQATADQQPSAEQRKTDYLALVAVTFIKFGDSVETFLPAVISQPIACELDITKSQEDILSVVIFITLAVSNMLVPITTNSFGRRGTILPALYITIVVIIICVLVPNYTTLLISRILLGSVIGFKFCPSSVYLAEITSDQKFYKFSVLITTTFYTLGGAWCGLLGYLFLDLVGWRYFFLISSLPVFLPPLILFQFFLPESCKPQQIQTVEDNCKTPRKHMIIKMTKLWCFVFLYGIYFYGAILLIPSVAKVENENSDDTTPCDAIHGTQFLIVTVVFGVCHMIGSVLWYFITRIRKPYVIMAAAAVLITGTYATMCFLRRNITFIYVGIGITQILSMISNQQTFILLSDKDFFTPKYLSVSLGVSSSAFTLGSMVGNTASQLLPYTTTLYLHLGIAAASFFCVLSFLPTPVCLHVGRILRRKDNDQKILI